MIVKGNDFGVEKIFGLEVFRGESSTKSDPSPHTRLEPAHQILNRLNGWNVWNDWNPFVSCRRLTLTFVSEN